MTSTSAAPEGVSRSPGLRRLLGPFSVFLWTLVLALAGANYLLDPSRTNLGILAVFVILCLAVNAEARLRNLAQRRAWRRAELRLGPRSYIDDEIPLPNRTYLLAEIRREIARSSISGQPFSLLHLSLHDLDGVRARRGDDFAERALNAMTNLVRRITRPTDFLARLSGTSFVIMLVNSDAAEAEEFLQATVPGWLSVSDGSTMLDIPIVARLLEYDMEGVYSSDILDELQSASPLMRDRSHLPNPA